MPEDDVIVTKYNFFLADDAYIYICIADNDCLRFCHSISKIII